MTEEIRIGSGEKLLTSSEADEQGFRVSIRLEGDASCRLHWGLSTGRGAPWQRPEKPCWPDGSKAFADAAVETPFSEAPEGGRIEFSFPKNVAGRLPCLQFVLHYPESDRWDNNGGGNYAVRIVPRDPAAPPEFVDRIVAAETGKGSWTLMHRYNLCHDLLDEASDSEAGLAVLVVWMRFSALRQLDWQRNYNTKPRELAHAQDRLGHKLTEGFLKQPQHGEFFRLMLGSAGRGGDGQKIRDEILHIMHRHHVKEVTGHFLEEWHQKLHNNTTPDDIVICRAYLEFLRSDGHLDRFYQTLEEDGVTRERLANYERPITTPPDFPGHLKDALIHDFEHFLGLLRSIHSGTDLDSAIDRAQYLFDDEHRHLLHEIREDRWRDGSPLDGLRRIARVRSRLAEIFRHDSDINRGRDGLYLDLALEEALRLAVESRIQQDWSEDELLALTGAALENVLLSRNLPELDLIAREWKTFSPPSSLDREETLRLAAAVDRLQRVLSEDVDQWYQRLQPLAKTLGQAFEAEAWTIDLFAEAVVRGRPAFALTLLVKRLDTALREKAGSGPWQLISRREAEGRIKCVATLAEVQGTRFDEPTLLLAAQVRGDEEPPPGAVGILTRSNVDLVSHVAVRARNVPLFFATCHDETLWESLESRDGQWLHVIPEPSGDLRLEESKPPEKQTSGKQAAKKKRARIAQPAVSHEPLTLEAFSAKKVGGKALNLQKLSGKLPKGLEVPASAALPFGTFEHILEDVANKACARDLVAAQKELESAPEKALPRLRSIVMELSAPKGFLPRLHEVMEESGIGKPDDSDAAWRCIKGVWASKWNERAFFSRRARGIREDEIFMAVLIQRAVPAEYAFVLHTANPFSDDANELYGETAPGLGETIVGNYPGRALGFTAAKKGDPKPHILAFPSKSVGLFGNGLIFRSDSNAEDLEGYAGAGLYDSLLFPEPEEKPIDYSEDRLVRDPEFRQELLTAITRAGIAVEKAFASPQDIEGAWHNGQCHIVQSRPQIL